MKITTWKEAYLKMRDITGEVLALADDYAGGESESVKEFNDQYEELDLAVNKSKELKKTP